MILRTPRLIPLRIRLPYGSAEEFIEKYGSNIARGGVFIATRALKPEGSLLAFELVLSTGTRVLRGEGSVVRAQVDQGGTRAGMTIRFSKLDSPSKALVDRVVAHRIGSAHASPPEAAHPSPPVEPQGPPAHPFPPVEAQESPLPTVQEEARARLRDLLSASDKPAPVLPEPDELVLGIDLGTTSSRVATLQGGHASVIPLSSTPGVDALPSLVALAPDGGMVAGEAACEQLSRDPRCVISFAKRLLGRRARSRQIQRMARLFPYPVAPDEQGDAGVQLGERLHRPPELLAPLLAELRRATCARLGRDVSRAVLCVPADFNDRQRSAMREAGRLAGLDVLRIFNEPSAVALAFGHGRALARKRILVYDLGGGTFDASVVELTGDDVEVVASGGDNLLGGVDFDLAIAAELTRKLEELAPAPAIPSPTAAQRLLDAAERAKVALSTLETTEVHVPEAARGPDGSPLDLRTELTRTTLEALTAELVERTVQITTGVLSSAGLSPQDLDEVLLAGGQAGAPLVRRRLQELTGKVPRTDVDPHTAVAQGAAILGHAVLEARKGKRGVTLSEVLSAPIGLGLRNGGVRRVLERNTRLPAVKTIEAPVEAGETLALAVYQGNSTRAEENEYLGCLQARAERAGDLSLRFSIGLDGTLELSALAPGGRPARLEMSTADAGEEARAALLARSPLPGEPDVPAAGGLLQGIRKLFGRR